MSKFLKPSGPRNLRELWYAIWQAFKNVESSIGDEGGGTLPPDPIPPDPPVVPGHYHDHRNILYRSEPDAHPISAITGLEDRISNFPYKDADTPVFLFGTGQSNLVGGPDAITEPYTPNAKVFDWSAGGAGQGAPHSWLNQDLTAPEYADYTADPNATYTGMTRGRGNMLWAAADVIQRRTGRDVYILNVGRNGTAIAEWLPGGEIEPVIVQRIAEVLATPELADITFADGIIWAQGESDGLRTIEDYATDFYTVRDWMEASFARKDTTLWAVTDTPSLEGSFFYNARYFYAYLDSRNDEFLRVVRADNYPAYDNLHFSGNDSMTMGTKVSRVFLEGPSPKMLNSDFDGPLAYELDDLTDVTITDPTKDGQGLFFSGTQWVNRASFTESWPTGLANGGELNIGPGGNDIEVITGYGVVVNSYADPESPPVAQALEWPQISEAITSAPAVAGGVVWFSIYDTGVAGSVVGSIPTNIGALRQHNVGPSPTLAREEIFLGVAIHNGVEWREVSNPKVLNQTAETLREVLTVVLPISRIISGGVITEQSGFTLNQDEGVIWENNRNWHVSKSDPNREVLPAATPIVFEPINRDFTVVQAPTSEINPDQWDNNGVIEPIPGPANTATIHRLYIDLANNYWLLIGQKLYANWNEAQANRLAYNPEVPFLLQNSLYLGAAIVEKGKADWDIDEATFLPPAESGGGGFAPTVFAGAGTSGYVPDPVTESGLFLKDDGTWGSGGGSDLPPGSADGQTLRWELDSTSWEATSDLVVSDAGNVGIGTASPDGNLNVSNASGNVVARLSSSDTGAGTLFFGDQTATSQGYIQYQHVSDYLRFATAGTERMRITSTGNVGIGTASPNLTFGKGLRIDNAGTGGAELRLSYTGTNNLILNADGDRNRVWGSNTVPTVFATSNLERMRITSDGNVGIGTSAPEADLQIGATNAQINLALNNAVGLDLRAQYAAVPAAQNHAYIGTAASSAGGGNGDLLIAPRTTAQTNIRFITGASPAERVRITADGNVGIGTATPNDKLEVLGSTSSVVRLSSNGGANYGGVYADQNGVFILDANVDGTGSASNIRFRNGGTEQMRITSDGKVGIGTAAPEWNLEVIGRAKIGYNGANTPALNIRNYANADHFQMDVASNDSARLRLLDGNATMQIGHVAQAGTGNLNFHTNAAERVRINSAGNVGIGLTAPTASVPAGGLDAAGYVLARGAISNHQTDAMVMDYNSAARAASIRAYSFDATPVKILFKNGPAGGPDVERMRIDSVGNVGIGLTNPLYNLHVAGTAGFNSSVSIAGKATAGNMSWAHASSAGGILGSWGVTSVTRQGVGSYYVNFTNAAPSIDNQMAVASADGIFGFMCMCTPLSTTRIQVTITNSAGSYADWAFNMFRMY